MKEKRNKVFLLSMTKSDRDILEDISKKLEISRAEAVIRALNKYYSLIKK